MHLFEVSDLHLGKINSKNEGVRDAQIEEKIDILSQMKQENRKDTFKPEVLEIPKHIFIVLLNSDFILILLKQ